MKNKYIYLSIFIFVGYMSMTVYNWSESVKRAELLNDLAEKTASSFNDLQITEFKFKVALLSKILEGGSAEVEEVLAAQLRDELPDIRKFSAETTNKSEKETIERLIKKAQSISNEPQNL
jgi:hypothetical protein